MQCAAERSTATGRTQDERGPPKAKECRQNLLLKSDGSISGFAKNGDTITVPKPMFPEHVHHGKRHSQRAPGSQTGGLAEHVSRTISLAPTRRARAESALLQRSSGRSPQASNDRLRLDQGRPRAASSHNLPSFIEHHNWSPRTLRKAHSYGDSRTAGSRHSGPDRDRVPQKRCDDWLPAPWRLTDAPDVRSRPDDHSQHAGK